MEGSRTHPSSSLQKKPANSGPLLSSILLQEGHVLEALRLFFFS